MNTNRVRCETADDSRDQLENVLLHQAAQFSGDGSTIRRPDRFLRLPDVIKRVGLGRASIYRLMEIQKFPKGHKLGERAVAWLESDVELWIQGRVQASKEVD